APPAILALIAATRAAMSPPAAGAAAASPPAAGAAAAGVAAAGAAAGAAPPVILALMASMRARSSSGAWLIVSFRVGGGGAGRRGSDVEEVLRHRDEVLQVEEPAQQHLHGQRAHEEQQHDHDREAREAQLVEEFLQHGLRQDARQDQEVA